MKRLLPLIVGVASGLAVLIGMFLIPQGGILSVLLNWVIVVASVALLVAIASLVLTHLRFIASGKKGFLLSFVLVVSFLATVGFGLYWGWTTRSFYSGWGQWFARLRLPFWVW